MIAPVSRRRIKPVLVLPSSRSEMFVFMSRYSLTDSPQQLPASPPQENSLASTSAESTQLQSQLLRKEETVFLQYYGKEQFTDMQANEYKNQFTNLLGGQAEITRHLRASVIDWLFEVGTKLNIEDKSVIF